MLDVGPPSNTTPAAVDYASAASCSLFSPHNLSDTNPTFNEKIIVSQYELLPTYLEPTEGTTIASLVDVGGRPGSAYRKLKSPTSYLNLIFIRLLCSMNSHTQMHLLG